MFCWFLMLSFTGITSIFIVQTTAQYQFLFEYRVQTNEVRSPNVWLDVLLSVQSYVQIIVFHKLQLFFLLRSFFRFLYKYRVRFLKQKMRVVGSRYGDVIKPRIACTQHGAKDASYKAKRTAFRSHGNDSILSKYVSLMSKVCIITRQTFVDCFQHLCYDVL